MPTELLNDRDLRFMLYELFGTEALIKRERYQDHDRQTFDQSIQTAKVIAEKYFLPIRQKLDVEQPTFDGKHIQQPAELKTAIDAVTDAGLGSPSADYAFDGMQLPPIVAQVAGAYLSAAGGLATGYQMLTTANANLLQAHGSPELIQRWVEPQRDGRFMGTMAMTEPDCGSSLGDLTTSAVKVDDGTYRITGNKIYTLMPVNDHREDCLQPKTRCPNPLILLSMPMCGGCCWHKKPMPKGQWRWCYMAPS